MGQHWSASRISMPPLAGRRPRAREPSWPSTAHRALGAGRGTSTRSHQPQPLESRPRSPTARLAGASTTSYTRPVAVLDWLLDSDPAIRWQVLRDLADAPAEVVAAERARVATEGWGARLLALQGEDGQWEGGALFPARRAKSGNGEQPKGQPWNATAYSLVLLHDFGIDPHGDKVRRAVAQVRDHSRWEHAGQPFFSGEVEPCINGMTVALGAYFDQDVDGVVARLLGEQLEDGGSDCEVENGSVRSSFHATIRVLEGLLAHHRRTAGSSHSDAPS